jgi:hypothetical protein
LTVLLLLAVVLAVLFFSLWMYALSRPTKVQETPARHAAFDMPPDAETLR